jgi:hypothetical protein
LHISTLFLYRYKYYVREQHSNAVVLASFQVTTTICNAIVLASFRVTTTSFWIILLIIIIILLLLSTYDSSPCLFYLSQICVTPMVLILVNTPRVFFKYSEQLAECQLIQSNANHTNMTLIDAPLLLSATNSIIMQYKINLKFN